MRMSIDKADLDELNEWISGSDSIVFFGGAGVSTASGIPDFRSAAGLYKKCYHAEEVLSHSFFMSRTEEFYDFYKKNMLYLDVKPNAVHYTLAALERAGKLNAVITQNIDGLHGMAGSKKVLEIHGSIYYNYCMDCGRQYPPEYIKSCEGVPHCECGGIIKPDVVLYEEQLDGYTLSMARACCQAAEVLIVGGTSLAVQPAAGLLYEYMGDKLVLINRDPTPADKYANLVIRGDIVEVFEQIKGI